MKIIWLFLNMLCTFHQTSQYVVGDSGDYHRTIFVAHVIVVSRQK